MEEILKYHMVKEEVYMKDFFDGKLLVSELSDQKLGRRVDKQRIVVKLEFGSWYLNWFTKIEEFDWETENGVIHAVDWVMIPPFDVCEKIFQVPFICSTFTSAVEKVCLDQEIANDKGLTVFVPTNEAWMGLNFTDLEYLFCPTGREDLKNIIQYHVCPELYYLKDMMEKEGSKIHLSTWLKGEKIEVSVKERTQRERERDRGHRGRGEDKMPLDHMFVLNHGEATIKKTDLIAENGTIHFINSVLIPERVYEKLPSRRVSRGGREGRYGYGNVEEGYGIGGRYGGGNGGGYGGGYGSGVGYGGGGYGYGYGAGNGGGVGGVGGGVGVGSGL